MIPANSLADDCDRIFADWGVPALLEEVIRHYEPQTGQLEESESSTEVTLIAGPDGSSPRRPTQATLPGHERTFLLRLQELPSGIPLTSAQVRFDGQVYAVRSVSESSINGLLALDCISDRFPPADQ